jgi:preprotein translocase subunit SecE
MIFKKKKRKQASPIKMPKQTNGKKSFKRRKKIFQFQFFRKKKNVQFPNKKKTIDKLKYFILLLIFIFLFITIFFLIKYVLILRTNISKETDYEITSVIGLDEIPAFPGSEFLFKDNMNDTVVKEFLSQGNSAYKLPKGKNFDIVKEYYTQELEQLGWELVQNVPLGTEDRKHGLYWIKEQKGLRIYSKFEDVWYETITEKDARSALSQLVVDEIEREMLMASSEKQDLLPDYPWRIQIPKEYIIKYSPTEMKDLRAVSFQKLGSNEIVEIFPVGFWKAKEMDYMLNDYCAIKSNEDVKCGVINSVPISFGSTLGLKSSIKIGQDTLPAYTIANIYNSIVYIITSNSNDNPLLEYIIENLQPMGED